MDIAGYVWGAVLVIAGVYELYAVIFKKSTLSQWIWRVSDRPRWRWIPFFIGWLSGHLIRYP